MMDMISLLENVKDFKDLEERIYGFFCEAACDFLKDLLESIDEEIMEIRDKKRYRLKNSNGRENTIITLMGEVKYNRRYYRGVNEDGEIYYGYLLDQVLGIEGKEKLTQNVKESAVETATRLSFRKSAELINKKSAYSLSAQTIWNALQAAGDKAKALENRQVKRYIAGELNGDKEVPVLFEEKDGVYLSIQGEKKKKEIKVSKVYEGWENKTPGSKEHATVNRMYVAGFDDGKSFDVRVNSKIASVYNMEKIKNKIVNADGAAWTKEEQEYDVTIIQQLDPFHIHRAILHKIGDKKRVSKIRKGIRENRYEDVFFELEGLYDIEQDEKAREKVIDLMTYLSENIEHLPRYTERGLSLPDGITYRGMGTMEGSNHNVICDRMKNRGMSWSIDGAEKMAKLLCLKHSDGLESVFEAVLPEDKNDIDININELIEKRMKETQGNRRRNYANRKTTSNSCGCHFSPLPFAGASITNGRKAIRNMLKNNLLY
jgi:hypothetical protein